jgi:hypothetical protein
VFLDHDDDMLPGCVETLVGLLRRFPAARAAFADHELNNLVDGVHFRNHHSEQAAFHRLRTVRPVAVDGADRAYGRELFYAMLSGNLLQQPWAIYRDDFLALGGFDPAIRYCEDWELYTRLVSSRVVALTDRVVSVHYIEGQNLHRATGQDLQHMKVIRKHLALQGLRDWRMVRILRPRLANYHKTRGDVLKAEGQPGAWMEYVRSLITWPGDLVVMARLLLWLPAAISEGLFAKRRRARPD